MDAIKAYFISDLHLTAPDEARAQALCGFLRGLDRRRVSHLFLLGDIFDLWIGRHNYFIERWLPVTSELLRLHQQGVEIHYFEGNHDLYLQSYFGDHLGFQVHSDPVTLQLGPWKVRLEHGDQMDPEDRGYLFLRWFLRTPLMKWAEKRLSEAFIVRLGEHMSSASRKYTSTQKAITEAVARQKIRTHAEKILALEPFDFLIAGHVHVREEHALTGVSNDRVSTRESNSIDISKRSTPKVINLGSWLDGDCAAYLLTDMGGEFVDLKNTNVDVIQPSL